MNADEIALLQSVISNLPVAGFLFYAWYQERQERILRTNQLVQKRQEDDNVQLQKERKEETTNKVN